MVKKILISVAIVVLAGAIVVALLVLFNKNSDPKTGDDTSPKVGDSVALADTPTLKTCELLSTDSIKAALGEAGQSLSDGTRGGVVAHNLQVADACDYTFTANGASSHLVFQTYPFLEGDATENSNTFDTSWQNIGAFNYPSYTLAYPGYYKKTTQNSEITFALQVVSGPRHYRFAIVQPDTKDAYDDEAAKTILIQLAVAADYQVANGENAPPAPNITDSSAIPPKQEDIASPPLPELPQSEAPDANGAPVGDTQS